MRRPKSICVFCGSSGAVDARYFAVARELAETLAVRGIRIVYGGASVGLMGAVADAGLAAGADVVGVIPRALVDREIAHHSLSELHVVETMHERKAMMASLSDAFIALPGGLGTLEELFEIWTWGMLGIHDKRFGLLDCHGYYDQLAAFLDHARDEGFIRPAHRARLVVASAPGALVDLLSAAG